MVISPGLRLNKNKNEGAKINTGLSKLYDYRMQRDSVSVNYRIIERRETV